MFEDLWIIDKSFRKYLDYFLEDKKVVWNGKFQFLTTVTFHFPFYSSLRWLTTVFFPITGCVTRALSKPRKISHAYKTRASETRKTPRSNNMKNFRKKFRFILGFLKKQFCTKLFTYMWVKRFFIITVGFSQVFGSRIWQRDIRLSHWRVSYVIFDNWKKLWTRG